MTRTHEQIMAFMEAASRHEEAYLTQREMTCSRCGGVIRVNRAVIEGEHLYCWLGAHPLLPPEDSGVSIRFGWKRLSDGAISQAPIMASRESLFEAAGFGAVRVDEPLKGYLAVPVEWRDGQWKEFVA